MLNHKVALLLWLYHTDLTDEFISYITPIKKYVDIHLGLCKDNNNTYAINEFDRLGISGLYILDNCGVDILPFLKQMMAIHKQNYLYFIKLHSKKSRWGFHRLCNWRQMLVEDLIGTEDTFLKNISLLHNHSYINAIGSKSFIFHKHEHIHTPIIDTILQMYNINKFNIVNSFVAGTMFIGRTRYLSAMLDNPKALHHIMIQLNEEHMKVKEITPTYSHAMERIFGYMANYNGTLHYSMKYPKYKLYTPKLCSLLSKKLKFTKYPINNIYKYHLSILKNQECYLVEYPNIYGKLLEEHTNQLTIGWMHKDNNHQAISTYYKISSNTLISV